MQKRILASLAAVVAIFTMVTIFQNCSSLDSPNNGSGDQSSYLATASVSDVLVAPGQTANVTVVLSKALDNPVTVSYRTADDTAIAGTHYQALASSIEIPSGQTSAQFTITTLASALDFSNKRFRVQISFSGNAAATKTSYISFTPSGVAGLSLAQKSSNSGLLSAGQWHTCALKNDALYCWGYNGNGQLGIGNMANISVPGLVASMDVGVTAVSSGRQHTCAIKAGALYCWGLNGSYQLGDGTATSSTFARPVFDMGSGVQAVSSGTDHTCAIKNGGLYCWGSNSNAQVGHNNGATQMVPSSVTGFNTGVTAVAAGYQFTCAIKNGGLYCWGRNTEGQLALGSATNDNNRNPGNPAVILAPITGFETGVIAVTATGFSTCATKSSGALYCWGYNASAQLGLGNATNTSAPNLINGFDMGVSHLISSIAHTCAIKTTGLHCWGYNGYGQLGNNTTVSTTSPSATPVVVTLATGEAFVHVTAGGHSDTTNRQSHTCARTNQNRVFCWGYNGYGEVGDNSTVSKPVPTLVAL